jgi:hypothetical protein
MTNDIVRVYRLIIYEGERDRVEKQLTRSMHGTRDNGNGVVITVTTLKEFPEIIFQHECEVDRIKTEEVDETELNNYLNPNT